MSACSGSVRAARVIPLAGAPGTSVPLPDKPWERLGPAAVAFEPVSHTRGRNGTTATHETDRGSLALRDGRAEGPDQGRQHAAAPGRRRRQRFTEKPSTAATSSWRPEHLTVTADAPGEASSTTTKTVGCNPISNHAGSRRKNYVSSLQKVRLPHRLYKSKSTRFLFRRNTLFEKMQKRV